MSDTQGTRALLSRLGPLRPLGPLALLGLLVLMVPRPGAVRGHGQPPEEDSYAEPHEEIASHRAEFDALDADRDGRLSTDEIVAGSEDEEHVEEGDVVAFIEELDTSGDRHVDWGEYMHALINQEFDNEIPEEFDGDMDGFVAATS